MPVRNDEEISWVLQLIFSLQPYILEDDFDMIYLLFYKCIR